MNVGIYTRWQRRDSTYAAIQVADLLGQWRHEVAILTPTPRMPAVSGFWDGRVRHDSQVRFADWAAPLAAVIWTFCPPPAQLEWAARAGKRTVLVLDWADRPALDAIAPRFDRVMVPARRWAGQLASLGIRNVVACPWSPMLPATRRSPAGPFRLYVPPVLRPGGDDDTALAVVEAVLARDRGALVAVSTCGRHHAAAKRLDRLARAEPRLTLDRPVDYHRHLLRYGEHSLTLLPAVPENFAMVALCSLHMGTPVVGLDAAPLGELANGENSVLVAGREDLPDAVLGLAGGPALARLFAGCPAGLARRRRDFEAAWAGVLPPAGGPGGRQQDPPEDRG